MKFEGNADYGGFFIQDPNIPTGDLIDSGEDNPMQAGIYRANGGVIIYTSDKCNPLVIEMTLVEQAPTDDNFNGWTMVVETSLELTSDRLVLTTSPDGEEYPFGSFPLESGFYGLRIYYRPIERDDSKYSEPPVEIQVEVWSSSLFEHRVIYP
jgi:hypothetical protein